MEYEITEIIVHLANFYFMYWHDGGKGMIFFGGEA